MLFLAWCLSCWLSNIQSIVMINDFRVVVINDATYILFGCDTGRIFPYNISLSNYFVVRILRIKASKISFFKSASPQCFDVHKAQDGV